MTINEIVARYVDEILLSESKEDKITEIINKIENLIDSSTRQVVSLSTQIEIIERIEERLRRKKVLLYEQENINYLHMLSTIRKELEKKRRSQQGGK